MPVVRATVHSTLSPTEALRILTDFSPARADVWAGVDDAHLKVHDRGETWADVTEGNAVGWERERYNWDPEAGTISAVTTNSNLWGPGSRWDYVLTPEDGGTRVDVTLRREGKGVKGKLIGALLPIVGKRMIASGIGKALRPS